MGDDLIRGRVLVTGASGGIGAALAGAFAAAGADLTLSGRRVDVLEPLAARLRARAIATDLADRAQVAELAEQAGAIDVLVANAALPASGQLLELTQPQIDTLLEVNLRAQIALARALAPGMVARGRGQLVFMSSLSGLAATPGSSLYSATKFALRGFALGLRQDLAPAGVGVSVIAPGFIADAGMFADAGVTLPRGVGTSSTDQVVAAVLRAIRRNRAETLVAPLPMKLGALFAAVAPGVAERAQRLSGASRTAQQMAEGQLGKRPPA